MGGGHNVEEKANLKKLNPKEKKASDHPAPNGQIIRPLEQNQLRTRGRMVFSSAPQTKKIAGVFQGNSHRGRVGGGNGWFFQPPPGCSNHPAPTRGFALGHSRVVERG